MTDDVTRIRAETIIRLTSSRRSLRVSDRVPVNATGRIVEHENHVDPRAVMDPTRYA